MKRLLLFLIGVATPSSAREWVLGDTLEEFEHIECSDGPAAARRWLRAEAWRVLAHAPRHHVVAAAAVAAPEDKRRWRHVRNRA